MNELKILGFPTSDLSSRAAANSKRVQVEVLVNQGFHVIFNFDGVKSISDSYADELFGVLLLEFGEDEFFGNIQLRNAQNHIVRDVAKVLQRRAIELKARTRISSQDREAI